MDERDSMEYEGKPIVFYYSREHRLARASQAVQDLNAASSPVKRGLFRTLTATKPLTFMFVSIITICLITAVLSFTLKSSMVVLENNRIAVSAIRSGGSSYVTITKKAGNGNAYTGPVNIAVSLPAKNGETQPIHAERVYFDLPEEELFRFVTPFTGGTLLVLVEVNESRSLLRINTK